MNIYRYAREIPGVDELDQTPRSSGPPPPSRAVYPASKFEFGWVVGFIIVNKHEPAAFVINKVGNLAVKSIDGSDHFLLLAFSPSCSP